MEKENFTSGIKVEELDHIVNRYESTLNDLQEKTGGFSSLPKDFHQPIQDLLSLGQTLKQQVVQTKELYHNLEQLMNATQIPVLFLDKNLQILRFTPEIYEIFPHQEFKQGQSLAEALKESAYHKIKKQIKKCFAHPEPCQIEFYLNTSQKWYLTRILPYPLNKDEIMGVILTFINITKDKIYEEKLNELNQQLELEVQKQNQQVRKLSSRLIAAEQKERKRIARLLHNDLQQQLFSIKTKGELLVEDIPAEYAPRIHEIIDQASQSLTLTHQLVVSLSPPNVENNDLYKGIHWLCKYVYNFHGLLVNTNEVKHIELNNDDVLVLILQMVQELLFNIVKHAGVEKAKITTEEKGGVIYINIIDEGKGFSPDNVDSLANFGLGQIQEQLQLIGGHCDIESEPGKGTAISLCIPRRPYIDTIEC